MGQCDGGSAHPGWGQCAPAPAAPSWHADAARAPVLQGVKKLYCIIFYYIVCREYVEEKLTVDPCPPDFGSFSYRQVEGAFSQPNAAGMHRLVCSVLCISVSM